MQTLKPGQSHEAGGASGVVVEPSLGSRDIGLFGPKSKVHGVFLASGPTDTLATFLRSLSCFVAEAHSGTLQLVQSKLGKFERLGIPSITSGLLEYICHQGHKTC